MNCAWCNPSQNGTDGICDACMLHFNIDPVVIHQSELDAVPSYVETNATAFAMECSQVLEAMEVQV